jgi:putative SOS response-associated peptidase YedK
MELEDPAADLIFHPVSRAVNSAANSGPSLTEAIELGAPETLF